MIIKLNDEFKNICKEIIEENMSEAEWAKYWSSDYFQTEHYCGGFDALEKAFVFGYYTDDKKWYSFLLKLAEIPDILAGKITEVDAVAEN